jgi:dTMP kinase
MSPAVTTSSATHDAVLVAITGIDGAGKSSLVNALSEADLAPGVTVAVVNKRERQCLPRLLRLHGPRSLERDMQYDRGLATAIRWAHAYDFLSFYENEALPALRSSPLVISDRWTLCSIAYANTGVRLGAQVAEALSCCRTPDLVIHLDIDPAVAYQRLYARGEVGPDEDVGILTAYRDAYDELVADDPSVVRLKNDDFDALVQSAHALVVTLYEERTSGRTVEDAA